MLVIVSVLFIGLSSAIELRNLALRKSAYQTDTFFDDEAGNAVDGILSQTWFSGSCSHTNSSEGVWWEVDLGDIYYIDNVKIYNRMDCCSYRLADVEIYTGHGRNDEDYVLRGFQPGIIGSTYTFLMPSTTYGRWVRITRIGDHEYLHLCEVEVYGHDVVNAYFVLVPKQIGTGHVLESTTATSDLQCCTLCLATSKCAAVNYSNVTRTCDILETVTSTTALTANCRFYRYP